MCKDTTTAPITAVDIEAPQVVEWTEGSRQPPSTSPEFHLRWSRLVKTVQIKENKSGLLSSSIGNSSKSSSDAVVKTGPVLKTILDEVSGAAKPGEVLALMGPSGSGKTSLLNVLSGRSTYDSGVITINGEPLTSSSRKKLVSKIAYVKQSDVFFSHLTVKDQLTYTALLRLPSTISREKKLEEVDKVISWLRLDKVADSQIMLCSGGEKKRTNIGTELLTDPLILLLDEPTSGLDSTSAVALMTLLQELARSENKTVITSIHQPSSATFRSFDKLQMLAEGHVVYFGTPIGSLTYLSELGLKTPDGYNAADHWMDLLVRDNLVEDNQQHNKSASGSRGRDKKASIAGENTSRGLLIDSWDNDAVAKQMEAEAEEAIEIEEAADTHALDDVQKYNTSWLSQFLILTHRSMKNSRSAIFTPLNMIKSAALGLVAGMLWFQMERTEGTIRDMSSFFFFTMTYWVFDAMFNALMAFPSERAVIMKERASKSYRLSAYFMAKTTSEAPTRLLLPLIYVTIAFWMSGINSSFAVFAGTTGCALLSCLAGEAIGLMIGAAVYDMETALTVMTVFALLFMALGGFFVQNVPSFLAWARYLSPFKYAFDGSQLLVFDSTIPCDGSGVLQDACQGSDEGFATQEQVLQYLNVEGTVGFNVGMLFIFSLVPRFFSYLALRSKKSGDRE